MRTVVVGAGGAGLWCALHAADRGPVTLVASPVTRESATSWAQGGIAAVVTTNDSFELHMADTLAAGAGLCDEDAVKVLVDEAPLAVQGLRELGMLFDDGGAPTLEGGHSARRVLHAGGDASGAALLGTIVRAVERDERIDRLDGRAIRVILEGGRAVGISLESGEELRGDRVVLATGGACGIFGRHTGPDASTGGGLALAWEAGAALADLEFVQFHPTALTVPGHPARLLTEALRGEGALLLDADGRRFMPALHPRAELAPRDVVARAEFRVMEETGRPVFLDATGVVDVVTRFPTADAQCREVGLDIAEDRIPVAPAAHYFTGGVLTDRWGRSTVRGLLACGEASATGVHGANRLASNSLAEALVFGRRAGLATDEAATGLLAGAPVALGAQPPSDALPLSAINALADRNIGVSRSRSGLEAAIAELDAGRGGDAGPSHPTASLAAWLVAHAALRRGESRGGHYRSDFPEPLEAWRFRQAVDKGGWHVVASSVRTR
ncbi:MAG: L-aspartate oxidase [Actinomycetota bacterium]|jgi:L-aspartate oxidase|nr:L-aspartate oxidase [Actinomycetota bacterium]